jgi:methyl coenzyme M reductase subunit C
MTVAAEDGFMMHEAASKVAPSRATTPILEITLELRRKRWTLTMLEIAPEITQPAQSRRDEDRTSSINPIEFADIVRRERCEGLQEREGSRLGFYEFSQ